MAHVASPSLVRQLGTLFEGGSAAGLSDRQLLERFLARRDPAGEAAFAAMVARHGPMVLGISRQLLGDHQHAEDAFQAVFLILARQARSIRDPDRLGSWLYGVALRTARKARVQVDRCRKVEADRAAMRPEADPTVPADRSAIDREQAEALHDEIDRLPSPFRLPVVFCYFEGLSLDEAARRLRCPAGTVHSQLVRARDRLRRGLTRRGIALPAAALAAVLDSRPASASVSSPLCDLTTRSAMNFTAGPAVSHSAAALAQEVLRAMLIHKLRSLALTLLLLGIVAMGAGYLTHALARDDEPGKSPAGPQTPVAAKSDDANPRPAPGRMFVVGRVRDAQGKPVSGATIAAYAQSLGPGLQPHPVLRGPIPIGDARADGSGRFRLDAPRTSSLRHEKFGAIALAPGHGAGWVELDPDDDQPAADIILPPEQVIHGRLFDLQGQPVPDVTLSVAMIRRVLSQDPARVRLQIDRVAYWGSKINDFPAWPRPVMTDPEGRFTLRGVGQGMSGFLTVHHPRFALQRIPVETDRTSKSKPMTAALVPAQILTGRLTYADTGEGVPHAQLEVTGQRTAGFETDLDGRFRINPEPGAGYSIRAYPPAGQPYLIAQKWFEWPKGAIEHSTDLALPRAISIHGKVTEEGSGKPVRGAAIEFVSHAEPHQGLRTIVIDTASDGSFQLGARPGTGHLFIRGPSDDYRLQAIGSRMYDTGQPGGVPTYAHAVRFLDLKPGMASQEVNLALRPGATVTGQVVGPDGQPVRDAWFFSRVTLAPGGVWRQWTGRDHGHVHDGRFEVHGLDPETETPVYFLDPKRKLGGVVKLSGKAAVVGPVTVRLEPCGAARARVVGPGGKPVAKYPPRAVRGVYNGMLYCSMVVTPGPPYSSAKGKADVFAAAEQHVTVVDPVNYDTQIVSDADGRIALPVLIPGATYRFIDDTMVVPGQTDPEIRKAFTVKPGETVNLGDLRVEKPPN